MARAYLGLGANIPAARTGRLENFLQALDALPSRGARVAAVSGLYESPPVGGVPQRPFLNAAVAVETTLGPRHLLRHLRAIESALGRRRGAGRSRPRTLDLDLLLYARVAMQTADLTLPHPRLRARAFVLRPLLDLSALPPPPGLWLAHPALRSQHVRRLQLPGWPPRL
ncbi:MAG: 2-amino-4-hydroxy-6-hydroxymethyldihydropteridine diphosphokinase [Terriglobales bacterium]